MCLVLSSYNEIHYIAWDTLWNTNIFPNFIKFPEYFYSSMSYAHFVYVLNEMDDSDPKDIFTNRN